MHTSETERDEFHVIFAHWSSSLSERVRLVRGYLADEGDDPETRRGFAAWLWGKSDRADLAAIADELPTWPRCECGAGGNCDNPAESADEGGTPLCGGCADGAAWSYDGKSDCRCCGSGEHIVWDQSAGCAGMWVYDEAPQAPEEDTDGEWAVVSMDGYYLARFASSDEANQYVERRSILFARAQNSGSTAYCPMSVCHVACGTPQRLDQWSTSWGVCCEHERDMRSCDD